MSNVYCPFCGVILLSDPLSNIDDPPSLTAVRPWYAEVRGVYSAGTTPDCVSLSGVGIMRTKSYLIAPLDTKKSYLDVGLDSLHEWRVCQQSEPSQAWCFAFHNSCWRLLLLRLQHKSDQISVAESVFHQLYCTPCIDVSCFDFGHDYAGAAHIQKSSGRANPVDAGSHLYADPCAIPSVNDMEADMSDFSWPSPSWDGLTASTGKTLPGNPRNNLDGLSFDLQLEILSYLPFSQLLNIRLVSRNFASLTELCRLPQSYWRTRFHLGQDVDFLFPILTDRKDWCRLFFAVRRYLKAGLLSLINRKRIRLLLEPIAALVELDTATLRRDPYGLICHLADGTTSEPSWEIDGEPSRFIKTARYFPGQITLGGDGIPLHEGCRVLSYRTQLLSAERQHNREGVGISTIQIGSRNFISGINLFPQSHDTVDNLLGYHIPTSEKWIPLSSASDLTAICVAFCSQGLRGIKLVCGANSSDWVGDDTGPGVAQGTLKIPPEFANRCFLLAGLDYFKIVSLSLGACTDRSGTLTLPSGDGIEARLWIPRAPTHASLKITPLLPAEPSRAYEPLRNIDFGGPGGLLLGSLTTIILYVTAAPCPILGIETRYSDGRRASFGSTNGCAIPLFIDGANGERVNGVSTVECNEQLPSWSALRGLQLSTNYGRVAIFAPLRYVQGAIIRPILTKPGETITGLVAFEQTRRKITRFTRIGVQSQHCSMPPEHTPLFPERHTTPDSETQYDRDFFSHFIDSGKPSNVQTYASLKNVRRLQASRGVIGRCRHPDRISGLKIEYYDHPSPGVVGQWMGELDGDGFEISPGEKVELITIILTPVGRSRDCPGREMGQVSAIYIRTSRSRNVTFCSQTDCNPKTWKFDANGRNGTFLRHQFQSDYRAGEEITALSWILNEYSECVRAAVSPTNDKDKDKDNDNGTHGLLFIPELHPPFDQVMKIYFNGHSQQDEYSGTITTASAYFQGPAIIGLSFVYATGERAGVGTFESECTDTNPDIPRQTVHVPQDAHIIGLSATTSSERELLELQFEVEQQTPGQSANYYTLKLSPGNGHEYGDLGIYDWGTTAWCQDEARRERILTRLQPRKLRDRVYTPPSKHARLVGLYVGCQFFSDVGAIYR